MKLFETIGKLLGKEDPTQNNGNGNNGNGNGNNGNQGNSNGGNIFSDIIKSRERDDNIRRISSLSSTEKEVMSLASKGKLTRYEKDYIESVYLSTDAMDVVRYYDKLEKEEK